MSTCVVTPDPTSPVQRSGGPRTAEGKDVSRRNALKRGLRSKLVFPDDVADLVEKRTRDFFAEFSPRSTYEEVLVRDMATASIRFERCASLSVADLIRVVDRAESLWEPDRRALAEDLASRLSKEPSRIVAGLRRTLQGTDFLVENWELLAEIARETGRWDDAQRGLAFDLLGVPRVLRNGLSVVPAGDETARLITLTESEIADLRELQTTTLEDFNDSEQAMAMAGMPLTEDAASARLRKDETRARNDFAKARRDLLLSRAGKPTDENRRGPLPIDEPPPPRETAVVQIVKGVEVSPAKPVEKSEIALSAEDSEKLEAAQKLIIDTLAGRPQTRQARKQEQKRARETARRASGKR